MAAKILVATSIRSLGELMQQALQETGLYHAVLIDEVEQVLERVQTEHFSLAIIDFGAVPEPIEFVAELRIVSPKTRLVVMPFKDGPQPSDVGPGQVDAWLSMPFYLPNLLETLEEVIGDTAPPPVDAAESARVPFPSVVPKKNTASQPAPEWLQDVNRVAQHLTRLSLESTAQAALITRGSQLWAYAGQLPQPAAEELARSVGHYWASDGGSDLARFIRLEATNGEYMMYATSLGGDYVLALAYETEMSFSDMRLHAGELAQKLSNPPKDDLEVTQEEPASQDETLVEEPVDEELPVSVPTVADLMNEDLPQIPTDWRPDVEEIAEGRQAFFEDLLASMEIPQPDGNETEDVQSTPTEVDIPANYAWDEVDISDTPIPQKVETPDSQSIDVVIEATPESLAETHPTPIKEDLEEQLVVGHPFDIENETITQHNLTYACILVPRLPRHHLVGDIAVLLTEWVEELSVAFGWRLEHLSIRPDYIHWIAVVPPKSSPGLMVHNIRRETSTRIFSEFPRFERENPSGEFWASGYLIVNGRDPFSRQMVHEFIGNVRSRQGAQ